MNGTIRYTIRPYDTIWMLAQVFNTTVDSIMELNPGLEPRNLFVGQVVTIRPGYSTFPSYSETNGADDLFDTDLEDLRDYFRMLWEEHVIWTRAVITGIVHDLPETELFIQRLHRNARDFGNAFLPFYGEEVAQTISELMSNHVDIAVELVRAARDGDNNAMTEADQRWRSNAEQLAEFLGNINPNWSVEDWSAMLNEHLDLLSANTSDMLAGNYMESINDFDNIEMQALEMADMMAEGIAEQFPD